MKILWQFVVLIFYYYYISKFKKEKELNKPNYHSNITVALTDWLFLYIEEIPLFLVVVGFSMIFYYFIKINTSTIVKIL